MRCGLTSTAPIPAIRPWRSSSNPSRPASASPASAITPLEPRRSSISIFFNQPTSYWIWSRNMRVDQEAPQTLPAIPTSSTWRPRRSEHNGPSPTTGSLPTWPSSVAYRLPTYGIIPYAEAHGYRETHRFLRPHVHAPGILRGRVPGRPQPVCTRRVDNGHGSCTRIAAVLAGFAVNQAAGRLDGPKPEAQARRQRKARTPQGSVPDNIRDLSVKG